MSLSMLDLESAACHTARPSCFYNAIAGGQVHIISAPMKEPPR